LIGNEKSTKMRWLSFIICDGANVLSERMRGFGLLICKSKIHRVILTAEEGLGIRRIRDHRQGFRCEWKAAA
jgi:hypothetical protein